MPNPDTYIGRALFYISQYPEGRDFLHFLTDADVTFLQRKKPSHASFLMGYSRAANCISYYNSGKNDPTYTVLGIVEEISHAYDFERLSNISPDNSQLTLRSSTILDRAIEASGKAAQARFAFTCYLQQEQNPSQFSPLGILDALKEKWPFCYESGLRALRFLKEGRQDLFTQKVFADVYEDATFNDLYDNIRLDGYLKNFPTRNEFLVDILSHPPAGGFMQNDSVNHALCQRRLTLVELNILRMLRFALMILSSCNCRVRRKLWKSNNA